MRGARNYNDIDEAAHANFDSFIQVDSEENLTEPSQIRDMFKDYFNSEVGSVPWQNETFRL